jgi:LuxR family transcriptional regulator, maltose regulon positive regulatory protein
VPTTIAQGQLAIDRAAGDDHLIRSAASALLGLAYWSGGDLAAAHRNYSISVDGLERAGHISDVLGCSIAVADIRVTQGRLGDAQRTFEHALRLAAGQPGPPLRGTADMHVGMSRIAYERGDVAAANRHLRRAEELGEHNWLPQNPYRWRVAMAAVREAEGDVDGALELLDQAQDVYVGDFSPNVRPVPAVRARVLVAHGRVDAAAAWARENGLSAGDDLSYIREFEHITLARVLLAQRPADAEPLLHRLLAAAEAGARTGNVIEILVLLSRTHHARGDIDRGLAALRRARTLAEPEGYVRVFAGTEAPRRPADALIDPLSERERGVLRLLASDLGGPAIARELSISLNTLRTHTKNIYAKLSVNDRRAAVRRAAELNL